MNLSAPLLVIAAGGTGGHMFPAQALAETMLARGWRVKLSTDARGARYTGGFPPGVEIEVISSATFARGGLIARALVPLRVAGGVIKSVWRMMLDRPSVIVGFGGYPAIPAMAAATARLIPYIAPSRAPTMVIAASTRPGSSHRAGPGTGLRGKRPCRAMRSALLRGRRPPTDT